MNKSGSIVQKLKLLKSFGSFSLSHSVEHNRLPRMLNCSYPLRNLRLLTSISMFVLIQSLYYDEYIVKGILN